MAWFRYDCPNHGEFRVSLKKREKRRNCHICGTESKPIIKAGSITVVETIDNGAMARKVEVLEGIDDIMAERAEKDKLRQPWDEEDDQ